MGEGKPNIIYIFADGLRYQSIGFNGDIKAKTPNIDMLAQCSTVMDNCVCNHPIPSSYCASLFSGKYSTSTGIANDKSEINSDIVSFADILADNGYISDFIGKWNLFNSNNKFIPEAKRLGFNGFFASFSDNKNFYYIEGEEKVKFDEYAVDIQTDLAISQLEKHKEKNDCFALFISLDAPVSSLKNKSISDKYTDLFSNVRFALPKNYDSLNDLHSDSSSKLSKHERKLLNDLRRAYYSAVSCIDYNIGKLMQKIIELELDDNTIIIFTSNYGEMFGSHGRKGNNIFYDEVVRVPFFIRYGEKLPIGKNESCFGTVDIMPTVLGLMNIEYPKDVQGIDKSKYILNGSSDCKGELIMSMGPAKEFKDSYEWRAYKTKQFTYAVYKSDNEEMLFDNLNDPIQTVNLIYDKIYLDVGKKIKDEMYSEMARINDNFENNSYYKIKQKNKTSF